MTQRCDGLALSFFSLTLILAATGLLSAQSVDRLAETYQLGGSLYYLTLPDTTDNTQDSRFTSGRLGDPEDYRLMIYSPVAQQVRIGRAGGAGSLVRIEAHEIIEYDLRNLSVPMNTTRNIPSREVIRVEASTAVVLYVAMSNHFGTAAFTPLPVEAWGTEYFAAAWPGDYVRNVYPAGETNYDASEKKPVPAEIVVVAAYDNTQVQFTPTDSLVDCNGCSRVTLQAGESYMVQSYVDTSDQIEVQRDIAGTRITASRPIGVISGNTRTQLKEFSFPTLAGNTVKDLTAEWLRPVDLHGTEFVQTQYADQIRPRGIDRDKERRSELLRIYPSVTDATTATSSVSNGTGSIRANENRSPGVYFDLELAGDLAARRYRTSDPAQAFHAASAHAVFRGTTGSGNFIGAAYDTWGTAMVELMPRERWGSFAPVRAPSVPATTRHFINIVTDSANAENIVFIDQGGSRRAVVMDSTIAGTDIVWTTFPISGGATYYIEGENGATFGGYVYGNNSGYELYRPGGIERDDKGRGAASAHPSEYEEIIAAMYAYPLPATHLFDSQPNSYKVGVAKEDCGVVVVTIDVVGEPNGFGRLELDAATAENARIASIDYIGANPGDPLPRPTRATVRIEPIDLAQPASAVLLWQGRSSTATLQQVAYAYKAEVLTTTIPVLVLFEKDQRADSAILFVNNADTTVRFNAAGIVGSNNLRIVRTEPPSDWDDPNLPLTLNPGASLRVFVAYSGNEEKIDSATLELAFPCATVALPIRVAPDRRCINVGDLDFGRVQAGASKTLALEVCNQGEGNVRFTDSSASGGGSFLSWIDDAFDVPTATIDLLKRVTLGPGNCVTINVTFTAGSDPEAHRSVARFWLDTRQCRDTSIWQAVVVDSTLSVSRTLSTSAHLDLTSAQLDADGTLAFALQSELHGDMRVALFDLQGNRVATPYAGAVESGEHQLRMPLPALPSGSYIIEITLAGERVARRLMLIR